MLMVDSLFFIGAGAGAVVGAGQKLTGSATLNFCNLFYAFKLYGTGYVYKNFIR